MKRIPFVITALYPYTVFLAVLSIFISPIIAKIPLDGVETALNRFLLPTVILTILLATAAILIVTVYHIVTVCKRKVTPNETANAAMKLKLIHIPAYISIFLLALLCLATIFTIPFALLLAMVDLVTIFATGTVHLTATASAARDGEMPLLQTLLLSFLGYIFLIDIVASVITHRRLKKRT